MSKTFRFWPISHKYYILAVNIVDSLALLKLRRNPQMSKFEQLLDLLVNEEMDKANELFHEIVVEKSREIYEQMIAEEAEENESVEETSQDNEEMEENVEEETTLEIGGDPADDFADDVGDMDAPGMDPMSDMDGDLGDEDEGSTEERLDDLEDALEDLKAEFEALMAGEEDEPEHKDMFGSDDEDDDEEGDDEEDEADDEEGEEEEDESFMGMKEGRKMTREYREKVGNDWDKNSMKTDGQIIAANTGEKMPNAGATKSVVSSAKGRPSTEATAHNILGSKADEKGGKGGDGLVGSVKGKFTKGEHNVDGKQTGVKSLSKVAGGHGAEKKGAGPGPVGSGTGDKAGQTNVDPATKKQFLPQYK